MVLDVPFKQPVIGQPSIEEQCDWPPKRLGVGVWAGRGHAWVMCGDERPVVSHSVTLAHRTSASSDRKGLSPSTAFPAESHAVMTLTAMASMIGGGRHFEQQMAIRKHLLFNAFQGL